MEEASPSSPPPKAPKKRKYIETEVSIHDQTQIEAVFAYMVRKRQETKKQSYRVEAFFFFPPAMNASPANYPKESFYRDLRPLLRLREPKMSYKDLTGRNKSPQRSPILFLNEYLAALDAGSAWQDPREAIDEARMFACAYMRYFFSRIRRRSRRFERLAKRLLGHDPQTVELQLELTIVLHEADELLAKAYDVLRQWRFVLSQAESLKHPASESVTRELALTNEYCTFAFRDGMALMLSGIENCGAELPGHLIAPLIRRLSAYIRLERWYAGKAGFMWVDGNTSEKDQEIYVHRRSALKKHVQRVLYLDVRTQPLFTFQKNMGAMAAAAVAATWAAIADIIIRTRAAGQASSPFGAPSLGMSTFIFITAMIMAYVLKDRIKEVGRNYFTSKIFGRIPDNANTIIHNGSAVEPLPLGSVREYTQFQDYASLPEVVRRIREQDRASLSVEDHAQDSVIHYVKKVELDTQAFEKLNRPIKAVHDILRFNVESFLPRLDDPLHRELTVSLDGDVHPVMMPKVYYLDMVLKYSGVAVSDTARPSFVYDALRLVMTKKGLVRVDRIGHTTEGGDALAASMPQTI